MIRSARTSLLRHDHPASRIRALATGRRDQLQLFDAVLDLRRAPAWEASAELTENPRDEIALSQATPCLLSARIFILDLAHRYFQFAPSKVGCAEPAAKTLKQH